MATNDAWTLQYGPMTQLLSAQGRGPDTLVAHMTPGELAVPPQVQTPKVMTALNRAFADQGATAAQYRAGSPQQSINPHTGMPEFQMPDEVVDPDAGYTPSTALAPSYAPPAAEPASTLDTGDRMTTAELKRFRSTVSAAHNEPSPWEVYDPRDLVPLPDSTPAPNPQQQSMGYAGILGRGILRAGEELRQSAQTVAGGTPAESATPLADFEQPVSWGDLFSPGTLLDKTLYQFAKSSPQIAAGVAGALGGGAAGAAIGPEGAPIGALLGGAGAVGLTSAFQALGPLYAQELKANPNNPDMAFDAALKKAGEEGVISTAAQAAFGFAPFKGVIKNVFMQAGLVQPGVAVAGETAKRAIEGQPIDASVLAAAPGAIVGTAAGEAVHHGGRYVAGKFMPNTVDNAKPLGDDETAALTLALPPPGPSNRPDVINVPPTGPGQVSPSDIVPGYPPSPAPPPPAQLPAPDLTNRPPVPPTLNVPPEAGQVSGSDFVPGQPPPERPPAAPPPPAPAQLPPPGPREAAPAATAEVTTPATIEAPDLSLASVRAGQRPDIRQGPEVPPGEPPTPPEPGGEPPPPLPPTPPRPTGAAGAEGAGVTTVAPEAPVEPKPTAAAVEPTGGTPAQPVTPKGAAPEPAAAKRGGQVTEKSAPEPSQITPGKEPPELQRIPGKPQGYYRVRQEDDGTVAADLVDGHTGRTTGKFVADDGMIADAGSGKEAWKAPNDAAQGRAAELLEQAVRRNYAQRITDALQRHVEGYENVGEQLKGNRKKVVVEKPVRGNVFTAEPTPEVEPPAPPKPRMSQMADEARAEAEGLAAGARLEPGEIPVKGQKAAPEAAPATMAEVAGTEGVGERSEQTTNKPRYARDYLNAILRGEMSPQQAHEAYGKQPEGAGRRRTYATFRDYVQAIHDAITKPGQTLTDRIASVQKAYEAGEIGGRKRAAAEREINRGDVMKFTPEGLKDILDRLPDPKAEQAAAEQAMLDAFKAHRDTSDMMAAPEPPARAALRPEASDPIRSRLADLKAGRDLKLHDLLFVIANHTGPRAITPQYAALARQLRDILPNLRVTSNKKLGAEIGRDPVDAADPRLLGFYSRSKDSIAINPDHTAKLSPVETLLHEAIHAATVHYLDRLEDTPNHNLTLLENNTKQAFKLITGELHRIRNDPRLTKNQISELDYALGNTREALTMLMTNTDLQSVMARTPASAELSQGLRRLGYVSDRSNPTVWQHFKNWVARIFGLKSGTSVLDHIMDPLTESISEGAAYRDLYGTSRYAGSGVPPREDVSNRVAFDDPLKTAKDATAAGSKLLRDTASRPLFRGALSIANLDAIHNWGKRLFESRDPEAPGNSLTDYRTAVEARAAATKAERDKYGNFVQRMVANLRSGPEGGKIAQLMNDATLAEARLGDRDPRANAHLRTEEQQTALKQLNDRYEALSQKGQETYRQLRDYYRETYNTERRAELDHALATFMPESTAAERASIVNQVRTDRGIRELLDSPDATDVAKAFGERWQHSRKVVQEIGRLQQAGFVRGDYFPLRRYGDYVVRYGERGTERYGVEMFERESQAQARAAELLTQGYAQEEVSPVFLRNDQAKVRDAFSGPTMFQLAEAFDRQGMTEAQRNRALDAYAEMQLRMGTRNQSNLMRARREGVLGPSKDQARNLANDFLAYSARMGWLKHGAEQLNALDAMDRHLGLMRRSGGQVSDANMQRAGMIRAEMGERLRAGDNSSGILGTSARTLSTMSFVMNLMRPAHMVVQLADAHSNATSLMGARHGFGAATLSLGKAVRDLAGTALTSGGRNAMKAIKLELQNSDWNTSALYRDRLAATGFKHADELINHLNAAGLIDHSMVREIQRMAGVNGAWDFGKLGKLDHLSAGMMNMFAAGEHAVDSMNRVAIAKAAFDLEMRKSNQDVGRSIEYAVQTAREAMPNYNLHNRPSIVGKLGALGGPIFQYKLYGMHMYSLMGGLAHDVYTGGGRGRAEAAKALGAILTSHALLSGVTASVFGSLPLAVGLGLYDLFQGDAKPHTATDLENAVRNWTRDNYGKTASEVIARGLPTLAGIDLHRSLKLANAVDLPEISSFKAKDMIASLGSAMTGASGENLVNMVDGLHHMLNGGDWRKGVEMVMPRPIHDVMQAYRFAREGVTDTQGRQILPPVSAYDAIAKGLGFNPSDVASGREGRQAEIDLRDENLDARHRVFDAYLNANPRDRGAAMAMIFRYNRDHPTSPITSGQIKQALTERARAVATPGTFGLRVPPKQLREMQQAGRFAQ